MKQMETSKTRSAKVAPPSLPRASASIVRRSRKPTVVATRTGTPSEEAVREAAYFHYVECGRVDGHEVEHWLHAEAELRSSSSAIPA